MDSVRWWYVLCIVAALAALWVTDRHGQLVLLALACYAFWSGLRLERLSE